MQACRTSRLTWRKQLDVGSQVFMRKVSINEWYVATVRESQGNMLKVEFLEGAVPAQKAVFRYSPDLQQFHEGAAPPAACDSKGADSDVLAMQACVKLSGRGVVRKPAAGFPKAGKAPGGDASLVGATIRVRRKSSGAGPDAVVHGTIVDYEPGRAKVVFRSNGQIRVETVPFQTPPELGLVDAREDGDAELDVGRCVYVRAAHTNKWCRGVITALSSREAKVVFWRGGRPCAKLIPMDSTDLWASDGSVTEYSSTDDSSTCRWWTDDSSTCRWWSGD